MHYELTLSVSSSGLVAGVKHCLVVPLHRHGHVFCHGLVAICLERVVLVEHVVLIIFVSSGALSHLLRHLVLSLHLYKPSNVLNVPFDQIKISSLVFLVLLEVRSLLDVPQNESRYFLKSEVLVACEREYLISIFLMNNNKYVGVALADDLLCLPEETPLFDVKLFILNGVFFSSRHL